MHRRNQRLLPGAAKSRYLGALSAGRMYWNLRPCRSTVPIDPFCCPSYLPPSSSPMCRVVDPELEKLSKWENHFTQSTHVGVLRLIILYFHGHLDVHLQIKKGISFISGKKITPIYVPFLSRKFAHQCIIFWGFSPSTFLLYVHLQTYCISALYYDISFGDCINVKH